ncbi:MAG: hypothetical protein ACFFED_13490 [Candidatus Thorarchaeota archaeon]
MIGGGMIGKLMKWGIMAGVALVIGTELLSSVSWVVVSMRTGDYLPVAIICGFTLTLQRISSILKTDSKLVTILVDILAGASMLYLFFVVLIGLIPFGLVVAIGGAGASLLLSMIIRDPTSMRETLRDLVESAEVYREGGISLNGNQDYVSGKYIEKLNISILQIPHYYFNDVVRILQNRPMLPVALLHLEDADFLFVRQSVELDWTRQVKRVLQDEGLTQITTATPLLKKSLLFLPLMEEQHGYPMSEYAIAAKDESISTLLATKPLRMVVFPSSCGIRIVVRKESILGIDLSPIPQHHLQQIILGREAEAIKTILDTTEGVIPAY